MEIQLNNLVCKHPKGIGVDTVKSTTINVSLSVFTATYWKIGVFGLKIWMNTL